jgi:hypothetical protein
MPPAWWSHRRNGRQKQHRGVKRPPEIAGCPAKPAASDVVAHATAQRVLATCASSVSPVEAAVNSTRNLQENLRDFSTPF